MIRRTKWSLITITVLIALGVVVSLMKWFDWAVLRQSLETMQHGPLLAFVAVLPIFGFSIALVYLVVGAAFGGWMGLVVVGEATAVHLLGSHWIARSFLRAPVERFLKRRKHQLPELPEGEEWAVVLMAALVPGLPYFVRNYLLALSGIPLRTYFWICWPVYVFRSSLVIFMGDFSGDISVRRVALLGSILAVKVAVCAYLIHRLRVRYKARPAAPAKKQAA